MKKTCIILSLLFTASCLYSQNFIMGVQYGIGSQHFTRSSDDLKTAAYITHHGSLMFEFSPYYSLLFINAGAEYTTHDLGTEVCIPLSVRIAPGKKVRPFFEIGGYYNYALSDFEDEYQFENDFGALGRAGLLFYVSKRFRIELSYFRNYGLTPALKEEVLLPLDQVSIEPYKRFEQGASLRLKFRLY